MGTRFGEERVEIFNCLTHDGARTVGTAESTATAVGQIYGVLVSQRLGKLQVALGRLHGAVQHDQARTCAELAIADGGAVFRDYGTGDGVARPSHDRSVVHDGFRHGI